MKNTVWKLFTETGEPPLITFLYKELTKDGRNDKSRGTEIDGLQGKR